MNQQMIAIRRLHAVRKQRGSFITELLGSWGLYALIGAVALAALGTAWFQFRGTSAVNEINTLYTATLSLKSSQGGYGSDPLVPVLIHTNSVPKSITLGADGESLYNSWGGEIQVNPVDNGLRFEVLQNDVPASQCAKIVQQVSNTGAFREVRIGGSAITDLPISVTDADNACGTDGNIDIAFVSVN